MNKRKLDKIIKRIINLPCNIQFFFYLYNKLKHFYYKLTRSTSVSYPSTVMLELTNLCNLACTTCPREYDFGKNMDMGEMSLDMAKNIIDELSPYLDSIGLTGLGETFLYKNIDLLVEYIKTKNKGIIISLSTNAQPPNFIEKVSKIIGKVDTIQISIDGLYETYEAIRKKSSFKSFDENLRHLVSLCKKSSTTLMLNMVVTRENFHQMQDVLDYAKDTGINYLDFTLFNLAAVTNIDCTYYKFIKSPEFLNIFEKVNVTKTNDKNIYVNFNNFNLQSTFNNCPFPWGHFYISWDGFVVPCCAKPFPKELNFGSVKQNNLIEILNSRAYKDFRKKWFKNSPPEFCNKCHFILKDLKELK